MAEIIQPFGDKVLVKVLLPETKTASGLYVAAVDKTCSNKGLVVAAGEGTTLQDGTVKPLLVKPGDTVLFTRNAGINFSTGKEDYKILPVREILGKFVENTEEN